jgi:hypothetical protein
MPLDRLIDLLAEAAVRKLSQEREKKEATPDAMASLYFGLRPYDVLNLVRYLLQTRRVRRNTMTRRQ